MKQIKFLLVATIVLVALVAFRKPHPKTPVDSTKTTLPTHKTPTTHKDPPCLQMYYHIERYADSFKIPKRFAYGIAKSESGYNGPFHWTYNHAVRPHLVRPKNVCRQTKRSRGHGLACIEWFSKCLQIRGNS